MKGFDAEFVVTASQVLHEGVTADHDRCGPIRSWAAHRAQPRLESTVIPTGRSASVEKVTWVETKTVKTRVGDVEARGNESPRDR